MITNWNGKPYHSLDYMLKERFGEKVYKVTLNGGMSCKNLLFLLNYITHLLFLCRRGTPPHPDFHCFMTAFPMLGAIVILTVLFFLHIIYNFFMYKFHFVCGDSATELSRFISRYVVSV